MFTLLLPLLMAQATPAEIDAKWGKNITAIEAKLKANPPKPGATMFAGSSTVVRWKLDDYFPGKDYINVGFGGSKIAECTHFAPRIIEPYKPGTIILSCGGNDLASKVSPEQVAKDFEAFVAAVRKGNPSCRVIVYSIKPTLKRDTMRDIETKANSLIQKICAKGDRLTFVDLTADLVDKDGKPKREMLVDDLLHPSHEAYLVMAAKVKSLLDGK